MSGDVRVATQRASGFGAVAARELRSQLASPLYWALLLWLGFLASALNPLAMIPSGTATVDGVRAFTNSAYALAPTFAIGGFFAFTFFAALLAAQAALRDEEAGFEELLRTMPVSRVARLGGQLAGVSGALLLALIFQVVVVAIFREMPRWSGGETTGLGPFQPGAYAIAAVGFALPWILVVTAVTFGVAERTRRPILAYLLPVVAFSWTLLVSWKYAPQDLNATVDRLLIVLDPTGIRWLDRVRFATDLGPDFYNRSAFAVDGLFWANRLGVVAFVAIAFVALARAREASDPRARRTRNTLHATRTVPGIEPASFRPLGDLGMGVRRVGAWIQTAAIAGAEVRELLRPPALALFTAVVALAVVETAGSPVDLFGHPGAWSSGRFAIDAIPMTTILIALYLLFAGAEAWHREESTGIAPILHATPVQGAALAAGKGLALAGATVWMLLVLVGVGVGLSWMHGEPAETRPLLLVFGLVLAPTFALWIAYVAALSALTGSRAATLALGLTTLVATGALYLAGEMTWVSNWTLWGALRWSDFATFPLNGPALLWNRLLAGLVACVLGILAVRLRRRIEPDALARAERNRLAPVLRRGLRWAPLALLPLAVATLLAIRVRDGFQGADAELWAERFERENEKTWGDFVPPSLRHLDLEVALEPERRSFVADGEFVVENDGTGDLRWLPLSVGRSFETVSWRLDGRPSDAVRTTGLDVLELDPPLAVGASLRVGFRYRANAPDGFTRNGGGTRAFVLPTSVALSSHHGEFLPALGYVARESGAKAALPDGRFRDSGASPERRTAFTARVAVVSPESLKTLSIGDRVEESVGSGVRRSVWRSEVPIGAVNVLAGTWNERRADGVSVSYLPRHERATAGVLDALQRSRERFSGWFGDYPWQALHVGELADLETNATAFPANLAISEGMGLFGSERSADFLERVTVHEVAHQWWGHLLSAAEGPGTGLLVEGLANYSTLRYLEAERGVLARAAYARDLERLYLERRRPSTERPILATEEETGADDAVLAYRGALALDMLGRELGDEVLLSALRRWLEEHRSGRTLATPHDLFGAIRASRVAPKALDDFVAQWFDGLALPELVLEQAVVEPLAQGFRLQIDVANMGSGEAWLEVEASGDPAKAAETSRARLRIAPDAPAQLSWNLTFRPRRIILDPDARLLQNGREKAVLDLPATADSRPGVAGV